MIKLNYILIIDAICLNIMPKMPCLMPSSLLILYIWHMAYVLLFLPLPGEANPARPHRKPVNPFSDASMPFSTCFLFGRLLF